MPKQQNDTAARPRWNRLWWQRPTPRGSISPNKMNRAAPYLFLAPSLAGLCVFVLVPFADAVRRSFTDAMGSRFVGLANYASVLGNSAFRLAAGNTAAGARQRRFVGAGRAAGGFYGHRRGFLGAHRHLCLEKCGL